ncbi:MAG: thioesterase family protein [Geitlerinemataceae cyanobacterium]
MHYTRTIHFRDTDAAGVVYFANVLAIFHEAYEASLADSGIELRSFFRDPNCAIPIVHANVDFFRPMFCGDIVTVHLQAVELSDSEFEVAYEIVSTDGEHPKLAQGLTRHVCIGTLRRRRHSLPEPLQKWLQTLRRSPGVQESRSSEV